MYSSAESREPIISGFPGTFSVFWGFKGLYPGVT